MGSWQKLNEVPRYPEMGLDTCLWLCAVMSIRQAEVRLCVDTCAHYDSVCLRSVRILYSHCYGGVS